MKNQAFVKLASEADDAYVDLDKFGVTLVKGWREALLFPAPVKDYVTNDSRLEHGISAIALSKYARLNKREVSIPFVLEGVTERDYLDKLDSFLQKIAYNGEICLKVPCLKKAYKLVYSQCSKFGDYGLKKGNFTLKFAENNPNNREQYD